MLLSDGVDGVSLIYDVMIHEAMKKRKTSGESCWHSV